MVLSALLTASPSQKMEPCLYFEGPTLSAIHVRGDEIIVDPSAGHPVMGSRGNGLFIVSQGRLKAVITHQDKIASAAWMKDNNLIDKLNIAGGDLYLNGVPIEMNGEDVSKIFVALPWDNGILCIGRTYRKKHKDRIHTFNDLFKIMPEDIEPYCAIWINPATHRGSSRWLYGKARRNLLVFPLPEVRRSSPRNP